MKKMIYCTIANVLLSAGLLSAQTVKVGYREQLKIPDDIKELNNPAIASADKVIFGIASGINFTKKEYSVSDNFTPYLENGFVSRFHGDGRTQLLLNNGSSVDHLSYGKNMETLCVKKITDGLGGEININYGYTDQTNVYTRNGVFYQANCNFLLRLIKSYSTGYASEHIQTTMKYANSRAHLQGKGFLGFESVKSIDDSQEVSCETTYECSSYYTVFPATQKVNSIMTQHYTNSYVELGNRRVFHYVSANISTDYLTGLSETKTILEQDIYGNPKVIRTGKGHITKIDSLEYVQRGAWCLNRLNRIKSVTSYQNMQDTVIKNFEYDNKGNLTAEILHPDKSLYTVRTEYLDFDSLGHSLTTNVKAKDKDGIERTRTSYRTYTPSGRFMASRTNVLGETVTYDWDEIRGLLRSETDPYGREKKYTYDGWGRLCDTRYPESIHMVQTLQWAGSTTGKPDNAVYYSYAQTSGNAPVYTWYDKLGREIRCDGKGLNNNDIFVKTEYYTAGRNKGKLYRVSEPYFANMNNITWASVYEYAYYGRGVSSVTKPAGVIYYGYDGTTSYVESPEGEKYTELNSSGLVESVTFNEKTVIYTYYPNGLLKTATPQDGQALTMEYNWHGNRTKLIDPDAGEIQTRYNGFGEIVEERQKIHNTTTWNTTTNNYNFNGLLQNTIRGSETAVYTYDNQNRVSAIQMAGKHKQIFTYDNFDRIINLSEEIDGRIYDHSTEYDRFGRVRKETLPSGYYTENHYDENGLFYKVTDRTGRHIWEAKEENARGQLTKMQSGNKITDFSFDDRGFPVSIVTPGITNRSYVFNSEGNLVSRKDGIANYKDSLTYDSMNRLTNWNIYQGNNRMQTHSLVYDPSTGNIQSNSNLENYTMNYGENGKPHALTSITGVPGGLPTDSLSITYTDFRKVKTLAEGTKNHTISYGVDDQRRKSVYKVNNAVQKTRYYLGDYEEEIANGNTRRIHYLSGGNGLAAIYVQNNGNDTLYYAHTDYQGSLIALSLSDGTVKERYAYDPWGSRRNPSNWTQNDTRTAFLFNRGYTMHEHLPEFGLINMNGRMYDPLTAQFFSPDPYLQVPGNWLNYNRYTYCLNNPLKYVDPNGEIFWLIPVAIGAIVGGYIGGGIQSGNWNPVSSQYWQNGWQGFISGAIVGATLGYGVSGAIGASGMTTTAISSTIGASITVPTKAAGLVSTMLNSGSINIGMNAISGGGWDGAWKAGVAGLASGAWTATGGFGMVKGFGATSDIGKLAGKLGYQMIGTAGSSIGNNWARGEDPFSKVTLGVGPVNLTLGKGQKLLQWQNNLGNIAMNAFGLSNLALGGKASFDWKNLSLNYTSGIIDKFYDPKPDAFGNYWSSGFGAHAVIGNSNLGSLYSHELHHLWQSRSMGDMFLLNYGLQGIGAMLMGGSFLGNYNYFETQADTKYWW